MAATLSVNVRNGPAPGIVTENVSNVNWKAVDDQTTPYSAYNAGIGLGTNSYALYAYLSFNGQFTTIGNVKITHLSGTLPNGVQLMTSPSIVKDSQKLAYSTPTRLKLSSLTPNNLSSLNTTVNLLVGPTTAQDSAHSPHKQVVTNNYSGSLYSNYFVSQLQAAFNATPGTIGPITLQITYDEV